MSKLQKALYITFVSVLIGLSILIDAYILKIIVLVLLSAVLYLLCVAERISFSFKNTNDDKDDSSLS